MVAFTVLATVLLAAQASASVLNLRPRSVLHGLLQERQTTTDPPSTIPPQTCTTVACLCTTGYAILLQDCVVCIVNLTPTDANISAGQTVFEGAYIHDHDPTVPLLPISPMGFVPLKYNAVCASVAGIPSLTLAPPTSTAPASATGPAVSTPVNSPTAPANTTPIQPVPPIVQSTVTAPPDPTGKSNGAAILGLGIGQASGAMVLGGVLAGVMLALA
ncbi:hypothetical protein H0H81_007252 [Sphagnurus paluster]|uniref:Uncharacterized protein n=1 Tax=Sphagnurus paluster TaxID=117069 RepID=A0A9P7FUS0_9AGAR|nr:hypothetical protein H0H81_007252 [Sphagnurus paluster]